VKVKPNDLPAGVPHERTIHQIGRSLDELAAYAADYGQPVRLGLSPNSIFNEGFTQLRVFDIG
jgi:hypothetical protein